MVVGYGFQKLTKHITPMNEKHYIIKIQNYLLRITTLLFLISMLESDSNLSIENNSNGNHAPI